ncbi:hypothetical protein [Xenorhabdus griffiniae]|uniref:Uncharacterized protein n=1 Tax=Xenorhabdus griffiniae TaxID=351672 RepID=A0ABY9XMB0_9GAMM|nr:hypothetical protein [Xenorhabdus griffiniae]MBD1229359.1 hypothetical protein [Xenorhabdus griffiniae]MBE8589100.1 hypothetical protein [Xenorhabdus griffiniae]WMV74010.1 hypothetical protein QL128_08450 [Xenorhabdus griffiniae]WNH03690.1 hypothetical protein QL112_008455 [Xenorhabdus griffiniae]
MKDNLESIFDNFFGELERKQREKKRENFWSNREPKQRMTKQERDTINVFSSFIPAINGAPSKEQVSTKPNSRRRLASGNVTARV